MKFEEIIVDIRYSQKRFKRTSITDAVKEILGTDQSIIDNRIESKSKKFGKNFQGISMKRRWINCVEKIDRDKTINGVRVHITQDDIELHFRVKNGMTLTLAQSSRVAEFGSKGVFFGSVEMENALTDHNSMKSREQVLRAELGINLEKLGLSKNDFLRLNRAEAFSHDELVSFGICEGKVKQLVKAGTLRRLVNFEHVDTSTERKTEFQVLYHLSQFGKYSGEQYLKHLCGLSQTDMMTRLYVRDKKGLKVELRLRHYELAAKLKYKINLSEQERKDFDFLRLRGVDLRSSTMRFVMENKAHWRRAVGKIERRFWAQKNDINLRLVNDINSWKQVFKEDLIAMGYKEECLLAMEKNGVIKRRNVLVDVDNSGKVEKKEYYCLGLNGRYSGLNYLIDMGIKYRDIQKFPQKRADLLSHDLFVPKAYLIVKSELENDGYNISAVKNESQQYRDVYIDKEDGKKIRLSRLAFQDRAFADCVITAEKDGIKIDINVEWGVYTSERMRTKCNKLSGTVVVVSTAAGISRYKKAGGFSSNVQFRAI